MDWCGRIGEVRELFRSEWLVGYHWVVPKIFSMPERVGPVYYSPSFKFLNMTWYFGIYRYSRIGDDEWIGFDIRRSTNCTPMPVRFSVGLLQADNSECLLHRNQNFPSRDNVCSINQFLLKSFLVQVKDKLAPSDELIVTCVIWPDVPSPGECKELCHSAEHRNSRHEAHAHKKAIVRRASVAEDVLVTEDESQCVETEPKCIAVSDKPSGNDGTLREISRGVEWDIRLPSSTTTWDVLSPEFTCGRIKYHFRMYSTELQSDDIYLGFIVNITNDANFPLPIRWRMAVKMRDLAGPRWVMNGQMTAEGECHQHAQEICIKRAELESSLSPDARLTFVHYLSVGEEDGEKDVSTQTDKTKVSLETQTEDQIGGIANLEDFEEQLRLCLTHPEEDHVRLILKKPLDPRIEKFLSELPRDDKKHFIFAA